MSKLRLKDIESGDMLICNRYLVLPKGLNVASVNDEARSFDANLRQINFYLVIKSRHNIMPYASKRNVETFSGKLTSNIEHYGILVCGPHYEVKGSNNYKFLASPRLIYISHLEIKFFSKLNK